VDRLVDASTNREKKHDQAGADQGGLPGPQPADEPHAGRHPNRGRGREPLNVAARIILEDDPGSQEPDAREGPLNGSARAPIMQVGVGGEIGAGHHGQRRPERHKAQGSDPGGFALNLTVEADGAADQHRRPEPDDQLRKFEHGKPWRACRHRRGSGRDSRSRQG